MLDASCDCCPDERFCCIIIITLAAEEIGRHGRVE
jgi:hypothetical protein